MQEGQTMDKLSLWAAEARRLGMRYGDYVAKYHPAVPEPRREEKKQKATDGQQRKLCQFCGGEISLNSKRWCYCSQKCAEAAHEEKKMLRRDRIRRSKLV